MAVCQEAGDQPFPSMSLFARAGFGKGPTSSLLQAPLAIPSPSPLKPFGGREAMQDHFLWLPGPGARGLRIGWCGLNS